MDESTINFILSFAAAFFAALSFFYVWCSDKKRKKQEIEEKEIELRHINKTYFDGIFGSIGSPEKTQMKMRKEQLEEELRKLKDGK